MVKPLAFGAAALHASVVLAAVTSPSLPTQQNGDLRLVKTAEDEAGVWMTEDEKFDRLISKHINFVDITDTMVPRPRPGPGPSPSPASARLARCR